MKKTKIVCVVGPTACHKTETAVTMAARLNGEIISADSVQVYIGMDIGSAKPTRAEQQGIPHHLMDCLPIDTPSFSVSQYRQMAEDAITDLISRNKTPVVVGGSGLYVSALTSPLNFAVPSDPAVRRQLDAAYEQSPTDAFLRLQNCDPQTAARLHPNDRKRVVRALEVYACSGKPLSSFGNDFVNSAGAQSPYDAIMIGLNMDCARLYARIDQRVDQMFERGLLQEAEQIYRAGYARTLPAMQSIGYRQLFAYFDGTLSLADATMQIKQETRRFAKRQMCWFLRDARIHWFDATEYHFNLLDEIEAYLRGKL